MPVSVAIFTVILVTLKEARVVVAVGIWATIVDLEVKKFKALEEEEKRSTHRCTPIDQTSGLPGSDKKS